MKLNRRNFVLKFFLASIGLLFLEAFWFERYIIDWKQFDISGDEKNKIKTIQLSDLHIDSLKHFHKSIAKRINAERPDILFITGDSVNYTSKIPVLDAFLKLIDPNILKIAIMGNKEYEGRVDIELLRKTFEGHNGKLLINQNLQITVKKRTLNIIGVDDYYCSYADFPKAAYGSDNALEAIVLNHCPAYRDEIDTINAELGYNIRLILSGHTHGGQITLFGKVFFKPIGSGRYLKGWYRDERSQMYVSKGIGTSVLPFRFGSRAEAILFYV